MMESQGGANRKMKHGGRSGFGVLPALTGLPTSISCQRCSKMVARAAFRCTGKRGSLLRMEWMRKGRGGGKRQCSGGRGEREGRINNNPSSFSVSQSSFASFPSVMWQPAQKTQMEKSEGKIEHLNYVAYPQKHTCTVHKNIQTHECTRAHTHLFMSVLMVQSAPEHANDFHYVNACKSDPTI